MKVLIVDDNVDFSSTIADIVKSLGLDTESINTPKTAINYMEREHTNIDLILLDIEFGFEEKLNGLDLLEIFRKNYPSIPIVMISGKGTIETAVKATKLGAVNFIEKNIVTKARIKGVIDTTLKNNSYGSDTEIIKYLEQNGIIGKSRAIIEMGENIIRYASTDLNVLITGNTGTGKKIVASCLHKLSKRRRYKLVVMDISNLDKNNYREELFGSMSSKDDIKEGLFQQANNGTLFLDKLNKSELDLQLQLLTSIKENQVRKVNGTDVDLIDIRFISTANKNLALMVQKGLFNEELYYKLRESEISIPPLDDRRDDIPYIVNYYTSQFNREYDKDKHFSPSSIDYLTEQQWVGNVKELYSFVRLCLQTIGNDTLEVSELTKLMNTHKAQIAYIKQEERMEYVVPYLPLSTLLGKTLKEDLAEVDKIKIENMLLNTSGNVSKASALLGISRETLHNKIRRYEINIKEYRHRKSN
jgi:DNA-binding NtrC family response regulator